MRRRSWKLLSWLWPHRHLESKSMISKNITPRAYTTGNNQEMRRCDCLSGWQCVAKRTSPSSSQVFRRNSGFLAEIQHQLDCSQKVLVYMSRPARDRQIHSSSLDRNEPEKVTHAHPTLSPSANFPSSICLPVHSSQTQKPLSK